MAISVSADDRCSTGFVILSLNNAFRIHFYISNFLLFISFPKKKAIAIAVTVNHKKVLRFS
jgi:hypothetical protein